MKTTVKYACQHCLEITTAKYDFLNSTTRLFCERCNKPTQVSLDKPIDFEAQERVRRANAKAQNRESDQ